LLGFQVVAWSLSVADWSEANPSVMAERLLTGMRPGSIVLLHDSIFRAEPEVAIRYDRRPLIRAVEMLLEQQHETYEFVTVPELMARGRPVVREWYDDGWLAEA
jgi:hypothetical protein